MTNVNIRYWKRGEKDGIVYFATATNAGHAKAEADNHAVEVDYKEYSENVPSQVHNGADRDTEADRAERANSGAPIEGKQAAWMALQAWTQTHSNNVAIQDMIAMLALWQWQLCGWANSTMAQQGQPEIKPNVN